MDYVLAYPQAHLEYGMYMELLKGLETRYGNGRNHVMQPIGNLYRQRQAGKIWNEYLVNGLKKVGFTQSKAEKCLFFRGNVIFIVYVDDRIFASPSDASINKAIQYLKDAKYEIKDEGTPTDYLGVNVTNLPGRIMKLSHPLLIDKVIEDVKLARCSAPVSTSDNFKKIYGGISKIQPSTDVSTIVLLLASSIYFIKPLDPEYHMQLTKLLDFSRILALTTDTP